MKLRWSTAREESKRIKESMVSKDTDLLGEG